MSTRSISFTDHHDALIDEGLKSGQYQNASEVVREAMRALELKRAEDDAKLDALRADVQKGIDAYKRGEYVTIKGKGELDKLFDEIEKTNSKRVTHAKT